MPVDSKEFFREGTLRICGSLEIEKALWKCFQYIQKFIPADNAYLHYYDHARGASIFFAAAGREGGERIHVQAHWPPEVRALAEKNQLPREFLSNRADEHQMAKYMIRRLGKSKSSVLTIRLSIGNNWLGGISLWSEGWDRFTQEHLKLFSSLRKPFAIALSNSRRYRELLHLKELLADDKQYLQDELSRISGDEIIGAGYGLKGVMDMVRQVAPLNSPVLLLGETGVGKEVIASALHNASPRAKGPLIKINCGAIPETLMDSEFFGHEKGAFTGAVSRKRGRFERAHGGTIFLDEIGELYSEAQVRLLRVLQDKEIERVGGAGSIKVDIRVIAATHRNLEAMLASGEFREDLYYRLGVFPIAIPPLRDRSDDIPLLVQHFIMKKIREMKIKDLPVPAPGALERLMAYGWPGNVRELENAVERELILSRGKPLAFADFQGALSPKAGASPALLERKPLTLDAAMAEHIRHVLLMADGKVEGKGGASELLGVKPGTLRHRMRKLGVPFGRKACGKDAGP